MVENPPPNYKLLAAVGVALVLVFVLYVRMLGAE